VSQGGNGFGLTFEAFAEHGVGMEVGRQQFKGYISFEVGIMSAVNGCHTAATQFAFYFITSDFVWWRRGVFSHMSIVQF
jgi:hypothetical protein